MKRTKLPIALALISIALFIQTTNAAIWRVNNNSNYNGTTLYGNNFGGTATYPIFNSLENANNSPMVSNGDTLHVEGSTLNYSGLDITKQLTLIGPGFYLDSNLNVSNNGLEARVNSIALRAGSSGTNVIGLRLLGAISIYSSNITIKRCLLTTIHMQTSTTSDISIVQNYFTDGTGSAILATTVNMPANTIINNNIFKRPLLISIFNPNYTVLQCNNNVFDGLNSANKSVEMLVAEFKNNILVKVNGIANVNNYTNNNVSYCISASATSQFGIANNNITVANMAFGAPGSLFAGGTQDGKYRLAVGSSGSNNGSDGTDRGAFGGAVLTNRYTLSGLAPIPVIYQITTTGVASTSNGLPVTIKARTIK